MEGQIDAILTSVADWKWCLDLLKPGGYLVFFGGDGFYRVAEEIEDTGFEIRDTIMWLHRTTKPIVLARKPFKGTLVENVLKNRVGGLNIDECRIPMVSEQDSSQYHFNNNGNNRLKKQAGEKTGAYDGGWRVQKGERENPSGRFPANLILSYDDTNFEQVCGGFPNTTPTKPHGGDEKSLDTRGQGWGFKRLPSTLEDSGGSAARYFYNAQYESWEDRENYPIDLVRYLVRLVVPSGGYICGSSGDLVLRSAIEKENDNGKNYKFVGV